MGKWIRSLNDPELRLRLLIALLSVVSFFLYFRGERINLNDGTGADGSVYAAMIRDLHARNPDARFDEHRLSRFAPCWCVAKSMRFFHIPPTNPNIAQFMNLWNWAMLLLGIWAALEIGKGLRLSTQGKSLLVCALFVSFPYLKMAPYYPVLFDTTGATIGLWMFAAFLQRQLVVLLLSSALGTLSWPTTIFVALPMRECPVNGHLFRCLRDSDEKLNRSDLRTPREIL